MAAKLKYNVSTLATDYVTIEQGAKRADVSYARFRKALQRLEVPVKRYGWGVMVPVSAIARVKKAFSDGTIKRGRKKKAE